MTTKKKKITVIVEGAAGVGKSTIAQQIVGQLQAIDIPATLTIINDEHPPRSTEAHMNALESIRERGIEVNVIEKQLAPETIEKQPEPESKKYFTSTL